MSRHLLVLLVAGWLCQPAWPQTSDPPLSLDRFGLLVAAQSRPSFAVIGAGARAAGMGGAFTALADDASAVSFNPAGLALLLTPEATVVFDGRSEHDGHSGFRVDREGSPELYSPSSSEFESGGVNFAAFTFPTTVADRNLSLQLSYHRLIDFAAGGRRSFLESPPGGPPAAAYQQTVDQSGAVYTLGLAAAYQLTQRLSLGLTLARWQGAWSFSSTTQETDLEDGTVASLRFDQDNEWSGWAASVGALLRYRYLNVGLAYRLPFEGSYHVSSRLRTTFENPFAPSSRLGSRLKWPGSFTLGVAGKPLETWILTADYAQYDWDDMVIRRSGEEALSFFDLLPKSQSRTEHRGQWRFGTEVTLLPGTHVVGLRAGYALEPRGERLGQERSSPTTKVFALGVGWSHGGLAVDLAWQRSRTDKQVPQFVDPDGSSAQEILTTAEAEVKSRADRLFLSVLYRFSSRDALGRFLHFLFVGPPEPGKS
ncbi:MAG: UPF0164 family protein [Thermoanaerobaculia bacterium]